MMLDDAVDWSDVDTQAVRRMIAESDAEGGEIPLGEVVRKIDAIVGSAPRR